MLNKMIDGQQKEKNIKDLEYNNLLNNQNIMLVLIGTAIISVFLIDKLPDSLNIAKPDLLFFLVVMIIVVLLYYSKKLEEKLYEIKNL